MPRRGEVSKRKNVPDPKYKDRLVAKLTNTVMLSGEKSIAEGIVYGAFDLIQARQKEDPLEVFRKALDNNRDLNIRNSMITQAFARASVLITNGAQVAVLVAGGLVVIWSNAQDLSPGGLMAFYVLLLRLYGPAGLFAGTTHRAL